MAVDSSPEPPVRNATQSKLETLSRKPSKSKRTSDLRKLENNTYVLFKAAKYAVTCYSINEKHIPMYAG